MVGTFSDYQRFMQGPLIEATLSPQEQRIVDYHRKSIKEGNIGRDKHGRPVTVYSRGIKIRKGPYKGRFVSVPGWVNGKLYDKDNDEDELFRVWESEINQGLWPMYDAGDVLNLRSKTIHSIMDLENPDR